MTIQLDNGTDIEITEQMISITNGFRGFTWDLDTNEVATATTTVIETFPNNTMRALMTKLMREVTRMLEYVDECCIQKDGEFSYNLKSEDLRPEEVNLYKKLYPESR